MSSIKSGQFDSIFHSYHQELLLFAGQQSNHVVAEDLVQEVYVRFLQQAQTDCIENPRAYLYKITRNLCTDYLRHDKVRARYDDNSDIDLNHIADTKPQPEKIIEAQRRLHRNL
jgi:RNA polymerase sigma factor (sigma-70 family)